MTIISPTTILLLVSISVLPFQANFQVTASPAVDIQCKFKVYDQTEYLCFTANDPQITTRGVALGAVTGDHADGKSFSDLNIFIFDKKQMKYFPSNFGDRFNGILMGLAIRHAGLVEVTRHDMKQLPNLEMINLRNNDIEIFEEGLFEFNPKLEYIYAQNNRIKDVGLTVFDHLVKLTHLGMAFNECVSKNADSKEEVVELIGQIKTLCYKA